MCIGLTVAGLLVSAGAGLQASDASDTAPKATHEEVESIGLTPETKFGTLSTLCIDTGGRLLAGDLKTNEVKVLTQEGKPLATWKPGLPPHAIHACADGTVYVGGQGALVKLNGEGRVLGSVRTEGPNLPTGRVSGIAATERDVFATFGSGWSLSARGVLVRFDRDLGQPKVIAVGLRGCCQRLDIVALDGAVLLAENARFRVVRFDREGTVLSTWGRHDRTDIEGFGACCNPMNLHLGPHGVLYTAESGLGRVKRYTPEGKYLGLVGTVGTTRFDRAGDLAASCSNIALAASRDGSRVFVQDVKQNIIRVLVRRAQ